MLSARTFAVFALVAVFEVRGGVTPDVGKLVPMEKSSQIFGRCNGGVCSISFGQQQWCSVGCGYTPLNLKQCNYGPLKKTQSMPCGYEECLLGYPTQTAMCLDPS